MNRKIKYLLIICCLFFLLMFIPIFVNKFIINSDVYSKATNDGWASFFGSYFGGVLGGAGTLAGVLITLRETRKENLKPFLVLDIDETPKEIFYPEKYSKVNKNNNIINIYEIPHIANLFNLNVRNTGKGYAKNIIITMFIKADDALITDNNLFWLNRVALDIERISLYQNSYIQSEEITYIGCEGDKKILPVNASLNAIILCSLWNIDNFFGLSEENFTKTKDYYYIKKAKQPLTIPSIYIHIKYNDLDNNLYEDIYQLDFHFILQVAGSHHLVRAKQNFKSDLSSIKKDVQKVSKPIKKKKKKKISRKTKRINNLRKQWRIRIYEYGMTLNFCESICKILAKDSAMERYFFLCYQNEKASLEQLINIIYVCVYNEVDISTIDFKNLVDLSKKLRNDLIGIVSYKNKRKYNRIINFADQTNYNEIDNLPRIIEILKSKENIYTYFYKSYEIISEISNTQIIIYDRQSKFSISVNIGNDELKTECGFYRIGFDYRCAENSNSDKKLIVSVVQDCYKNVEIGFFDERGIIIEKEDNEWNCIYLR